MFRKNLLLILLIILVFVLHQSLFLKLNARFNFWPAIMAFIIFVFGYKTVLNWGVVAGFLLDLFSALPFGINLISLFIIILILYLLIKNLITNRSLFSLLILSLVATLVSGGLFYFASIIFKSGEGIKLDFINLNTFFVQLVSNLIFTLLAFFVTLYFTKKLNTNLILGK